MRKKIMYAALGAVLVWTLGGCQKAPEVKEERKENNHYMAESHARGRKEGLGRICGSEV